jgi:hypothetical protein
MRWYLHKEVSKGKPFLLIHKNCKHLLRTLPDLVHDENKAGDLNSKQEDHLADCLRYVLKKMPKPIDYRGTPENKVVWGVPTTYPKINKE